MVRPPCSLLPILVAAALCAAGCSRAPAARSSAATSDAADLRARSQAFIDSGNASYRRGDYATAAKRYSSAAAVDSTDPAACYGLGMALAKLGRGDEAREAYAHARLLAGRQADTTVHAR